MIKSSDLFNKHWFIFTFVISLATFFGMFLLLSHIDNKDHQLEQLILEQKKIIEQQHREIQELLNLNHLKR